MRFLLRRLLLFALALLAISLVIFAALRILPGDVATIMAGLNAPPDRVEALRAQLGLNRSLPQQYGDWMLGLLHGDFGLSMLTGRPIAAQVGSRAALTFPLITLGLAIALIVGIPLGCLSLMASSSRLRSFYHILSIVGGSIPALWGGLLLILLFSRGVGLVGLLPSQGFPESGWADFGQALESLTLPALTLGILVGASLMRYTRSALGELADSGWIDMARACGMTHNQALVRVGLRLALPQLVSVVGLTFAEMITGAMVVENLFALPGLGSGLVTDLGNRDLIAVQSELFMLAAFFLGVGLIVDLLHRALDPRLKASSAVGEVNA
ncbi:ABC transporter permease [Bombiscardovia apis]|uniref:ABC transporter permease n=1 Tax=Bombiscardovia apis TaxID=2932182 RepID=A0ABN6SG34_9BIFI|nr:ABC transporter permease [Bombiscardovia apis]BDR54975.1 ABC transporter permease [Bombiscardovia apis]